jgi:hypothetical protein
VFGTDGHLLAITQERRELVCSVIGLMVKRMISMAKFFGNGASLEKMVKYLNHISLIAIRVFQSLFLTLHLVNMYFVLLKNFRTKI